MVNPIESVLETQVLHPATPLPHQVHHSTRHLAQILEVWRGKSTLAATGSCNATYRPQTKRCLSMMSPVSADLKSLNNHRNNLCEEARSLIDHRSALRTSGGLPSLIPQPRPTAPLGR